jgi:hydroxymethylpyrimidine/phosphomethylpyrimidine kinase
MAASIPRALTIAGSDSGGGAGLQADLKTFAVLGVFGTSAIAAVTAQNTRGVAGIHAVPAEFVELQIATVLEDIGADAVKTGMLANRDIVLAVARAVERFGVERLVVDPVLVSKHGEALLTDDAVEAYVTALLPRALIVTPNAPEAARLAGFEVNNYESQCQAAREIARMGPRYVIVKGGHITDSTEVTDVLYDGHNVEGFACPRIEGPHSHGTGCTFSAALAAHLALGDSVRDAVGRAKSFVTAALKHGLPIGGGIGPVNPMWGMKKVKDLTTEDAETRIEKRSS